MFNNKNFLILILMLFMAGCETMTELNPGAERVEVLYEMPKDLKCKNLGPIVAYGKGAKTSEYAQSAYNQLRNKAHAIRATHIIVKSQVPIIKSYGSVAGFNSTPGVNIYGSQSSGPVAMHQEGIAYECN